MQPLSVDIITHMVPDKFALRVFNRLAYNREISGPLIASYLLMLLNNYSLSDNVKSINLVNFWKHFSKFALHIYKPRSATDNFLRLWHQTSAPSTIFDHYYYQKSRL